MPKITVTNRTAGSLIIPAPVERTLTAKASVTLTVSSSGLLNPAFVDQVDRRLINLVVEDDPDTPNSMESGQLQVTDALKTAQDIIVAASGSGLVGTVTTADDTATAALLIPVPTDTVVQVQVNVIGRNQAGSEAGGYLLAATFRNDADTVTQVGATAALLGVEDVGGWAAALDVSGTDVRVRVTGEAATDIDWKASARIVSSETLPVDVPAPPDPVVPDAYLGPDVDYVFDPSQQVIAAGALFSPLTNFGTTVGNADGASDLRRPVAGTFSERTIALFDGVGDAAIVADSDAGLGDLYDTGVFELFMLFRLNRIDPTNIQYLLSQGTATSEAGIKLEVRTDGTLRLTIYSEGSALITDRTFTDVPPLGDWALLEIIGDGTDVTYTLGDTLDTQAINGAALGAGPADFDMCIGARRDGLANWTQFDLGFLAISTATLTAPQRTAIRSGAAAFLS